MWAGVENWRYSCPHVLWTLYFVPSFLEMGLIGPLFRTFSSILPSLSSLTVDIFSSAFWQSSSSHQLLFFWWSTSNRLESFLILTPLYIDCSILFSIYNFSCLILERYWKIYTGWGVPFNSIIWMPWIFVNILLVPHSMHIAYMYLLYAYTALLLILHTYMPWGCNKHASYTCTITWLLHRAKQISAVTRFYLCLYRFCLHAWLRYTRLCMYVHYSIILYLVAYCIYMCCAKIFITLLHISAYTAYLAYLHIAFWQLFYCINIITLLHIYACTAYICMYCILCSSAYCILLHALHALLLVVPHKLLYAYCAMLYTNYTCISCICICICVHIPYAVT